MSKVKKVWARRTGGLLTVSMLGVALAGCGGNNNNEPADSASQSPAATASEAPAQETSNAAAAPLKITITAQLNDAQPPKMEGNSIWDEFQKITNSDIKINFVPNANYVDKFNLSLAGGDLTDVVLAPAAVIKSTGFVNAARGGSFWDLTDELKRYPNIMKNMNDIILTNTAIDGKVYGIPLPRPTARVGLLYRKDWFDSLGIKVPATLDEFYNAAKEIKAKMPDVIPFSYADQVKESTWNGLDLFTVSLGGYNIWGLKDGKMNPYYETPEYMNVLNTFRNMNKERLLNKDFPIVQGAQKKDAISTGKAAMFMTAYDDLTGIQDSIAKIDPKAEIALQPVINGLTDSTSGHNGMFVIPKSAVKTQEEVDAILTYFNRTLDDDVMLLKTYGIEGQTFNQVDGAPAFITPEAETQFKEDSKPIPNVVLAPPFVRWPNDKPSQTFFKDAMEKYAATAVANLSDPFISPTYVEKGGELDKIVYDARVKYILGEIDEAGYASAMANWHKQGGDKIIEEYTAEYNKANGQ